MSADQIELIPAWIDQGAGRPADADELDPRVAKTAEHWSFKPIKGSAGSPLLFGIERLVRRRASVKKDILSFLVLNS